MTRLPIIPTIIVAAAVAVMIGLGIWQLGRADEKALMLARYETAQQNRAKAPLPFQRKDVEGALYRTVSTDCLAPLGHQAISGRSAKGEAGIAHMTRCRVLIDTATWPEGEEPITEVDIITGWSRNPADPAWAGGSVTGMIAPSKNSEGFKLVAQPPVAAGTMASAMPDPADLPNNHLSYAVQWFFFAATALVIYSIALRQRRKA